MRLEKTPTATDPMAKTTRTRRVTSIRQVYLKRILFVLWSRGCAVDVYLFDFIISFFLVDINLFYNRFMARHSHWAQIKLKKGALDKKRGKVFTQHARLIEVAARQAGGDPNTNASLRMAIENARADNLPRENIDRAVKKGTGELKEGEQMQEVTYEGFGPGGTALLIEVLTDNKNRANQMVRRIVEKHGGKLGAIGSVSFLFETKGVMRIGAKGTRDEVELSMIDAGAEEIEESEGEFIVYTAAAELSAVKKRLQEKGFTIISAELAKIPKNTAEVNDKAVAEKILQLLEALEEEEDVLHVWMNAAIST